jgi:hypothetical protein
MNHLRLPAPRGRGLSSDSRPGTATTLNATEKESKDRIVQQTDQDASQSRLSAVEMGYLVDDFAKALCTNKAARKFPLINRGVDYFKPAPALSSNLVRGLSVKV